MEKAINWFKARELSTVYSMEHRNGPQSYDCSSAVYYALKTAGLLPANTPIGNTDSLFGDLERNGFVRVPNDARGNVKVIRGDIFIWGKRGASGGASGHTGIFLNEDDIIHCNYGYNGITINNHNQIAMWNGYPELTVYRYVNKKALKKRNRDQNLDVGSWIRFDQTYTVDDIKMVGGIKQIRTNKLCPIDFTWEENGIPVDMISPVDAEGYAIPRESIRKGTRYKIPGKFKIHDLGLHKTMWIGMVMFNKLRLFIDIKTTTEIDGSDPATKKPEKRPKIQSPDSGIDVTIKKPEANKTPKTVQEATKDRNKIKGEEEKKMAYTPQQTQELKIATDRAFSTVEAVRNDAGDVVKSFSLKTRIKVYIFADAIILLGITAPSITSVVDWDINKGMIIGNMLVTAGTFILTMFGLLKKAGK